MQKYNKNHKKLHRQSEYNKRYMKKYLICYKKRPEWKEQQRQYSRKSWEKRRKVGKTRIYTRARRDNNLKSWAGFIPVKSKCQICSKVIYFNKRNNTNAIHFDHRNGGIEPIHEKPYSWLGNHIRNMKNEIVWRKCKFGILCQTCNRLLPTKKRKWLLNRINRYVFK